METRLLSAPLLKVNFKWFGGKPISWQKVKVLTAKQNAPKETWAKTCGRTPV